MVCTAKRFGRPVFGPSGWSIVDEVARRWLHAKGCVPRRLKGSWLSAVRTVELLPQLMRANAAICGCSDAKNKFAYALSHCSKEHFVRVVQEVVGEEDSDFTVVKFQEVLRRAEQTFDMKNKFRMNMRGAILKAHIILSSKRLEGDLIANIRLEPIVLNLAAEYAFNRDEEQVLIALAQHEAVLDDVLVLIQLIAGVVSDEEFEATMRVHKTCMCKQAECVCHARHYNNV